MDHLFVNASYLQEISRSANHSDVLSRITAAFLLPKVLDIRIPRRQAVMCANCLSCRRDSPRATARNILSSESRETLDVDYQVRITDAHILTNAQVIGLQALLTARFEYILKLIQQ